MSEQPASTEPSSALPCVCPVHSRAYAALFALILVGFAALGALRLNAFDLYNPDSPRYTIYAHALASGQGYRMVDDSSQRYYSWRPIGLSLFLSPAACLFPCSTVAAKVCILGTGIALLAVFGLWVQQMAGWSAAVLVTALLAVHPLMLVYSTEVLTEVPFTLLTLVLLVGLSRTERPSGWAVVGMGLVALPLPLLRTVGVVFFGAWMGWAVITRRWRWLVSGGIGLLSLLWWMLRNAAVGDPGYAGALLGDLGQHPAAALTRQFLPSMRFYATALPRLLVTLASGSDPQHVLWTDPLPRIPGLSTVGLVLGWGVVLLACLGFWRERRGVGCLAFAYFVVTGAALLVWPWRDERFLFPLLPVCWGFVPAGASVLMSACRMATPRALLRGLLSICVIVISGWEVAATVRLVETNVNSRISGDAFYDQSPPVYYSDWHGAGRWLQANSSDWSRLATWHAATGLGARRVQVRVAFEAVQAQQLKKLVSEESLRYLVFSNLQFGAGVPPIVVTGDADLLFTPRYSARGVTIVEIEPNRTGIVRPSIDLAEWREQARRAVELQPGRSDLQLRYAEILHSTGQTDVALQRLQQLADQGMASVRLFGDLGWMYIERGKYPAAINAFLTASRLPFAESAAGGLQQGAFVAQQRMESPSDGEPSRSQWLERATVAVRDARLADARRHLDAALKLGPPDGQTHFLTGEIDLKSGRLEHATVAFEEARRLGEPRAEARLRLLEWDAAARASDPLAANGFDPTTSASWLELASQHRTEGTSGVALELLERALDRFPNEPEIEEALADLWLHFSRPDRALPLYQSVLARDPSQSRALDSQRRCEALLTAPPWTRVGGPNTNPKR